jgi:peptidoglycan/xylan/chitin deacetylase (PgdA/CDA1 family)
MARHLQKRFVPLRLDRSIVTFTFDDVPATAVLEGGPLLAQYGARSTYFVSLGLLDTESESGRIAGVAELARALQDGHELGCHTFDHVDAWHTSRDSFMASVERNRAALDRTLPNAHFTSFAYPKSGATWSVKRDLAPRFACCRGGGQSFNADSVDLGLVSACFLDARAGVDLPRARALIQECAARRGWLVFATHDVAPNPSPYGCTPEFLDAIARFAAQSGADLLPMGRACARVFAASR